MRNRYRSVAIGRTQREQHAVWPSLVDSARERGAREQSMTVRTHIGKRGIDRMAPVGVEEKRCSGAVGETECIAGGPFATAHHLVEPRIRRIEHVARIDDTAGITVALCAQAVEYDLLLRCLDVVVEETIHRTHFESCSRVAWNQRHGAAVIQTQMLDDDARLDDGMIAIDEHRKAP